ncbi:MAG TPA: hypothetical protein VK971_13630, partial [Thiohalobacter sp.]|nr:hypothetical protein [Thiohalobacter sp.]
MTQHRHPSPRSRRPLLLALGFVFASAGAVTSAVAGPQYEYRVFKLDIRGSRDECPSVEERKNGMPCWDSGYEKELNQIGAAGWEILSFEPGYDLHEWELDGTGEYFAFARRPIGTG